MQSPWKGKFLNGVKLLNGSVQQRFGPLDPCDQDYSLLGLLGSAVRVFGGAGPAQVQEAEGRLQAEALLGEGGGATGGGGGGVVVGGRSVVHHVALGSFCSVTSLQVAFRRRRSAALAARPEHRRDEAEVGQ